MESIGARMSARSLDECKNVKDLQKLQDHKVIQRTSLSLGLNVFAITHPMYILHMSTRHS